MDRTAVTKLIRDAYWSSFRKNALPAWDNILAVLEQTYVLVPKEDLDKLQTCVANEERIRMYYVDKCAKNA